MNEENRCPQCGAELAANAPRGLCPACLLKGGLGTETGPWEGGGSGPGDYQPPTPAELAPCFPDLEILELVGRGGMGVVYKARQKRLDRLVALKILSPKISHDPAFAERFAREARWLAMLNHPHIVAVYDFGQAPALPSPLGRGAGGEGESLPSPDQPSVGARRGAGGEGGSKAEGGGRKAEGSEGIGGGAAGEGGLYYFLMEFVDGVNLRRLLGTDKLLPEQALAIVPQICDALQYAHDAGVVHRDIKPENILLDSRGRVKIADFGLAKLVGQPLKDFTLTGEGQVMGTPHYMAPEQLEHPKEVDHRADIYSLGVVFYQMLTGELPIGKFAPPSQRVEIDVRLDDVVLRALEKEPERRYQQVSELKTRVESIATTPPLPVASSGEEPKTPFLSPWILWFPLNSPTAGEICAHTTAAERRAAALCGALYWLVAAVTLVLPVVIAFALSLAGVSVGVVLLFVVPPLLIHIALIPNWRRKQREFLCSTAWAKQKGITPDQLIRPPKRRAPAAGESATWPRFSRLAIVGAVWATLFLAAIVAVVVATAPPEPTTEPASPLRQTLGVMAAIIVAIALVCGAAAPVGTTILGVISISQIRHSAGRLYGLGLALFDAILFPLLLLDSVIVMVPMAGIWFLLNSKAVGGVPPTPPAELVKFGVLVFYAFMITLALAIDYLIARWAWRAANRPVGADVPLGATGSASAVPPGDARHSGAARSGTGGASGTPSGTAPAIGQSDATERARRQVLGPAIGLLVTGILDLTLIAIMILGVITFAAFHQTGQGPGRQGPGPAPPEITVNVGGMLLLLVAGITALVVLGLAAPRMRRLQAYPLAIVASILAMIILPGNVIGLPIGIWALIVLSRPEVRAAFGRPLRSPTATESKLGLTAFILSLSAIPIAVLVGSVLLNEVAGLAMFVLVDIPALVLGIVAWRSAWGKAAAIIVPLLFVLLVGWSL